MADVVLLDLCRLLAGEVLHAQLGLEGKLAEHRLALVVDQLVGIHARTLHVPVIGRDAPGALDPGDHVQGFGVVLDEVVEAPGFLPVGNRVWLERVDHVRELDRIADEEHLEVVAHQVPVAVLGVELDGESARVARRLGRFLGADHGGEAQEHRRLHAGLGQHLGAGVFAGIFVTDLAVGFEPAMGSRTARMHHALGNALAVEMGELLDEGIVFQRGRPAFADRTQALVILDRMALPRGECFALISHGLPLFKGLNFFG